MTEIQSGTSYYGFIGTEFVQWSLTSEGHLQIGTLAGQRVFIGKEKWQHKRKLFGPGRIEFKLAYNGRIFILALSMLPIRERDINERWFLSGRNGPWNMSSRPFSSIFQSHNEIIDPDAIAFPQKELKQGYERGVQIESGGGLRPKEDWQATGFNSFEEVAAHTVGTAVIGANLVVSEIIQACPTFNAMYADDLDGWTRVWGVIFVHSHIMLFGAKVSPDEHKALVVALHNAIFKAPRMGLLGTQYFTEYAQHFKSYTCAGIEGRDLFKMFATCFKQRTDTLQIAIGFWAMEKGTRKFDQIMYLGSREELSASLGQAILAPLTPYLLPIAGLPDWRGQGG